MNEQNSDKVESGVTGYSFINFEDNPKIFHKDSVEEFEIKEFSQSEVVEDTKSLKKKIRIERKTSEANNFEVAGIVSKHRGLLQDREDERQLSIEREVERRVALLKEKAIAEGFEEGKVKGEQVIIDELRNSIEEKLLILSELINDVVATRDEILVKQKKEMFTMIRNLTKWIILRELDEDGDYVHRLLEKLIIEIQSKSNILIQLSKNQFEKVPEALELIKSKIGPLENVRVEVDYDIEEHGIILSSDNGIIKGTLEQQFHNLSKLFESVGVDAND